MKQVKSKGFSSEAPAKKSELILFRHRAVKAATSSTISSYVKSAACKSVATFWYSVVVDNVPILSAKAFTEVRG